MSLLLRGNRELFEIGRRRRRGRGSFRERERVREGGELVAGERSRAERAVLRERDPELLRAMRRLLWREGLRVHELRDGEVRAECARRLRRGELELRVLLPAAFITTEAEELPVLEPEPPPSAPEPESGEPESVRPPPIEEAAPSPPRPWRGDAAAQAQVLIAAAREGEPFCEICAQEEAKRKAREQSSASRPLAAGPIEAPVEEGPVAVAAAEAQIQALVEAAENATPFCEICEAAKAARAAPPPPAAAEPESLVVEQIRAAAQAETLVEAAERGTPFCEVCEQARGGGGAR